MCTSSQGLIPPSHPNSFSYIIFYIIITLFSTLFLTTDRNTNAIMVIQQNFSIGTVASLNKHWCVSLGGEDVRNNFSAQLEQKQE